VWFSSHLFAKVNGDHVKVVDHSNGERDRRTQKRKLQNTRCQFSNPSFAALACAVAYLFGIVTKSNSLLLAILLLYFYFVYSQFNYCCYFAGTKA
jgi:hypothetical protein